MPKEPVKAFRKGTKSCTECRQRKLRCLPSDDDSKPCQNCAARGRTCILQVEIGRTHENSSSTARDRIGFLENSVSQLWHIVGQLRSELGHQHEYLMPNEDGSVAAHSPESDDETSPLNPPAHLQQLFDNEFVDTQTPAGMSSNISSDRISSPVASKARTKLQALMPSKDDIRVLCQPASMYWISIYASLFPTINMFNSGDDMLAQYDALTVPTASPTSIAALLVSVAITLAQRPKDPSPILNSIPDETKWMKAVDDNVGLLVVKEDDLACTIDGVEASLLHIRLQLITAQTRTLWLMLRRVMAIAEFIGLPRAAQRATAITPSQAASDDHASKYLRPTMLWKSICSVDRLVGTMFNLPFGTAAYGFPAPESLMLNGNVLYQDFFSYIAFIAGKVQDVDEAYLSRRPETEVIDMVCKIEQERRKLTGMVPPEWWDVTEESPLPAHILQFWFYYFTVRAHLQLALRNGTDSHIFSYVTCYEASRSLAKRYVKLRALLPSAFFAGRVLDLQALTGAVVLLFTSQGQAAQQDASIQNEEGPPSIQLVGDMIKTMESISSNAAGVFAKQCAPALRALTELLNKPRQGDSTNLTLHIPMLGKINVSRHAKAATTKLATRDRQQTWDSSQPALFPSSQQPYTTCQPSTSVDLSTSGFTPDEILPWSMDLMMDDFVPFADDSIATDHYWS